MSGDIVAELQVLKTISVAQIKAELAAQSKTPSNRLKLFHEDEDLADGTILKQVCKADQEKIDLQLIRLSGYSFAKKYDADGKTKYSEYLLSKIVLTGDSGTGKTNLMTRFARNTFTDEISETVGVDYFLKTLTVDESTLVKCQISDTAAVNHTQMSSCYRGAHGIMVVCDVTNRASFENLRIWLDLIKLCADPNAAICVVANKVDLEAEREVTCEEIQEFAWSHGTECFEVSAKTDHNVDEPFYFLTGAMIDKRREEEEDEEY
jgi:Ras-related protein Rab-1A